MTDNTQPQDEQAIIDRHVELLKQDTHEGVIIHPYLDSKGFMTAGSGNNIERYINKSDKNRKAKALEAFLREPWYTKNGDRPASRREKENNFEKLWQETESNKDFSSRPAKSYQDTTDLYLITKDINRQVRKDAIRGRKDAKEFLGDKYFNRLTPEQQIVTSDIALQLGKPKFQEFKKFRRAVIEQDAQEMVRQSLVISSKDNDEIRRNYKRVEENALLILGGGEKNRQSAHELIYEGIPDFDKEYKPADYLKKVHRARTEQKKSLEPASKKIKQEKELAPKPKPKIDRQGSLLFHEDSSVAEHVPHRPLTERDLIFNKGETPHAIFSALGHSSSQKPQIKISQPIRSNAPAHGEDIVQIRTGLEALGQIERPDYGIVPFVDRGLFNDVKRFQKDNALKVDGIINPLGETITKLNQRLQEVFLF